LKLKVEPSKETPADSGTAGNGAVLAVLNEEVPAGPQTVIVVGFL
jgi:hypothetical protein